MRVTGKTGADMAEQSSIGTPGGTIGMNQMPGMKIPSFYSLATDKVRYVGDPIAMVVAESRAIAEDAVELIVEDIDWLDPVMTYDDALDPASPLIFDSRSPSLMPVADSDWFRSLPIWSDRCAIERTSWR